MTLDIFHCKICYAHFGFLLISWMEDHDHSKGPRACVNFMFKTCDSVIQNVCIKGWGAKILFLSWWMSYPNAA